MHGPQDKQPLRLNTRNGRVQTPNSRVGKACTINFSKQPLHLPLQLTPWYAHPASEPAPTAGALHTLPCEGPTRRCRLDTTPQKVHHPQGRLQGCRLQGCRLQGHLPLYCVNGVRAWPCPSPEALQSAAQQSREPRTSTAMLPACNSASCCAVQLPKPQKRSLRTSTLAMASSTTSCFLYLLQALMHAHQLPVLCISAVYCPFQGADLQRLCCPALHRGTSSLCRPCPICSRTMAQA